MTNFALVEPRISMMYATGPSVIKSYDGLSAEDKALAQKEVNDRNRTAMNTAADAVRVSPAAQQARALLTGKANPGQAQAPAEDPKERYAQEVEDYNNQMMQTMQPAGRSRVRASIDNEGSVAGMLAGFMRK